MEYRISYPNIPNMGDLLNKDMLESLFDIEVQKTPFAESNMLAIGSSLRNLLLSSRIKSRFKQRIKRLVHFEPYYVWGTGFMYYDDVYYGFKYNHIEFLSLRGNLSKGKIEKILKKDLDIPLGDGGLLVDRWIGTTPAKKYRIGIIPHFKEVGSPLIQKLKELYDDSTIIDLGKKPIEVVKEIASCETILSSSLHGLIVADSFHIPNMHILLYPFGEKMLGDGFKFADYYSSYGLKDIPLDLTTSKLPTIQSIIDDYRIVPSVVEKMKDEIYSVFPK